MPEEAEGQEEEEEEEEGSGRWATGPHQPWQGVP